MSRKRVPGYARYEMDENGTVFNVQTGSEMKVELRGEFPDVVPYVRLTSDRGARVRVSKQELYNTTFPQQLIADDEASILVKSKANAKQPSKSQQIWLMHKAGLTITQMWKKGYNRRHAYNVINRDYADNKELQRKAEAAFIYQNDTFKAV